MTVMKQERARLALPASNGPAAPPAEPKQEAKQRPKANDVREFQMLDGRVIALHRSVVTFAVAERNEPDTATIVGLRNARAVPIRLNYTSFMAWWRA